MLDDNSYEFVIKDEWGNEELHKKPTTLTESANIRAKNELKTDLATLRAKSDSWKHIAENRLKDLQESQIDCNDYKNSTSNLKRRLRAAEGKEKHAASEAHRLDTLLIKRKTRIAELETICENTVYPIVPCAKPNAIVEIPDESDINLRIVGIRANQFISVSTLAQDAVRCLIRWSAIGFIAYQISAIFV